jgi:tryptophan-rich hypothetical protein
MNHLHPKKLLQSKWTAVQPRNKEKHFMVIDVICDVDDVPQRCVLQAVHSRRDIEIDWRELRQCEQWRMGWR